MIIIIFRKKKSGLAHELGAGADCLKWVKPTHHHDNYDDDDFDDHAWWWSYLLMTMMILPDADDVDDWRESACLDRNLVLNVTSLMIYVDSVKPMP